MIFNFWVALPPIFEYSLLLTSGLLQSFVYLPRLKRNLSLRFWSEHINFWRACLSCIFKFLCLALPGTHMGSQMFVRWTNRWSGMWAEEPQHLCRVRPGVWECSRSEWGIQSNGAQYFLKAVQINARWCSWSIVCSATVSSLPLRHLRRITAAS